jgi:hypothetical protein
MTTTIPQPDSPPASRKKTSILPQLRTTTLKDQKSKSYLKNNPDPHNKPNPVITTILVANPPQTRPCEIQFDLPSLHNYFHQQYLRVIKSIEVERNRTDALNYTQLPTVCWVNILQNLSPQSIFSVVQVCQYLHLVSSDNRIWKKFWRKKYEYSPLLPTEKSWKLKYRFYSGHILLSGSVQLKSHKKKLSHWQSAWIAISDAYLYIFSEPQQNFHSISDIIRFEDSYLKIPLNNANIVKKNGWYGQEKYKFKVITSESEKHVFSVLCEEDLTMWCDTLRDYVGSINENFADGS